MLKTTTFLLTFTCICFSINAQTTKWSERMAQSFIKKYPDSIAVKENNPARWAYEQGLMLKAIECVWRSTANPQYFNYIQHDLDRFINADGSIRTYALEDYNLDNISSGRALLMLYQQSLLNKEKYRKAADLLWKQLESQPLTQEGGYWYKNEYANQMWLEGLFMAEPFSAEYSKLFNHEEHFDKIAMQFALIEKHAIDPETGLIFHGYDESKQQRWANKETGLSQHFWGRAIGWYAMALVDVLDYFPEFHPQRPMLISYLQRLAPVLVKYQDSESGVWYQMTALAGKKGNYLEASSSAMFTYALLKGVRKGYLDTSFRDAGIKGFEGMLATFVTTNADGTINLEKTVSVGGLGGSPYRYGSYEYYLSEPIKQNDLKGVGSFIFAATEMERLDEINLGKGKRVGLDYYFNREFREGYNKEQEQFHYIWEDTQHSGFQWFGDIFMNYGAEISAVTEKPSKASLNKLDVYIIVDPDDEKETPSPNFINAADVKNIKKWVKNGGTLLFMTNDAAHCDLVHSHILADAFGIPFAQKNINAVDGKKFEMGSVEVSTANEIFINTKEVFIKDLVTLKITENAKAVLIKGNDVVLATTNYKKGRVMIIGDPWLYNEYVDGRIIPMKYQNFQAAKDLAKWLVK